MRCLALVLANAVVLLLLLVLVEGLSSAALFLYRLSDNWVNTRRAGHTQHDPELGWVNRPNVVVPDMYGPGVSLTTNSRGFRGHREVTAQVPAGKRRLICSGDSVTLGFRVGDDQSWCSRLESLDPRLETVNMGQAGYGADQAYLWYKRDAAEVRHQIQLFAMITDDFRRMHSGRAWGGYGKPLLVLEGAVLKVKNVPVSAPSYYVPWVNEFVKDAQMLQTAEVLRLTYRKLRKLATTKAESTPAEPASPFEVAVKVLPAMLEDLKRVNEERSSLLVLVYLPSFNDRDPLTLDFFSSFLAGQADALGIPLINLVEVFQKFPDHAARELYLPDQNHFNVPGNAYIAQLIYERLRENPETSRILAATTDADRGPQRARALSRPATQP